jgi:hypothetical protein
MLDNYEWMFGEKPKEDSSTLEKGDHPEIDDSDFLEIFQNNCHKLVLRSGQYL